MRGRENLTKEYPDIEHLCDSCEHNTVHVRLDPDSTTLNPEGKEEIVKAEPVYTYACKEDLNNAPKVIVCSRYSRMRNRR